MRIPVSDISLNDDDDADADGGAGGGMCVRCVVYLQPISLLSNSFSIVSHSRNVSTFLACFGKRRTLDECECE